MGVSTPAVAVTGGGEPYDAKDVDGPLGTYFLLFEVVLFCAIGALALQQTVKIFNVHSSSSRSSSAPVSLTGGRTRTYLMIFLFLAVLARVVSLTASFYLGLPTRSYHNNFEDWRAFFIESIPSLLFLTTYSIIILFWAQVYYAAILVSLPLLRPIFLFINVAIYLIYAAIAALTVLLRAYKEFRSAGSFFSGGIFLTVAVTFAYFGGRVASQLSSCKTIGRHKSSIIQRVILLAVFCPIFLALKGIYSLAFALRAIPYYYPTSLSATTWDSIVYLTSEAIPSFLILLAFWSRKPPPPSPSPLTENLQAPLIHFNYLNAQQFHIPSVSLNQQPSVVSYSDPPPLYGTRILSDG